MSVYSESQNWASDLQEGDFKKNFEEGDLIISPSSHNSWLVQEIDFDADNFISTLGDFSDKKDALQFAKSKSSDDTVNMTTTCEVEVLEVGRENKNNRVYTEKFVKSLVENKDTDIPVTKGYNGPKIGETVDVSYQDDTLVASIQFDDESLMAEQLARSGLEISMVADIDKNKSYDVIKEAKPTSFRIKNQGCNNE